MKYLLLLAYSLLLLVSCDTKQAETAAAEAENPTYSTSARKADTTQSKHLPAIDKQLPTVGILMYPGVLTTEVTAAADVFTKPNGEGGEQLFNVVTIAETTTPVLTEENLTLVPDYSFVNAPALTILFVPSAYDMYAQVHNKEIIDFIQQKNEETTYTVSNCAGAQLIGAAGIAKGKKIVTWIGGGEQLQADYPELLVQNENEVTFVRDGKFFSSNGNLASYVSSLELLEVMTSKEHRAFVESYLYLDRLQDWK